MTLAVWREFLFELSPGSVAVNGNFPENGEPALGWHSFECFRWCYAAEG
jgi:hypothetical protein